jgi:hypothetical protein
MAAMSERLEAPIERSARERLENPESFVAVRVVRQDVEPGPTGLERATEREAFLFRRCDARPLDANVRLSLVADADLDRGRGGRLRGYAESSSFSFMR